jgi:hypothetical protein
MFVFLFRVFCFLLCVFCFFFCIFFLCICPHVYIYSCLLSIFVQLYRQLPPGGDPVAGKGGYTLVTLPRIVTPYRDSVDGTRDHVTYQKLVTR